VTEEHHSIHLEPSQQHRAAALLARAFHDDPVYKLTIPDEDKRASVLTWLFEKVIRYCILYGHTFTTPKVEGVAGWLPPGHNKLTLGRIIRSGLYATPLKLGWAVYRRFDTYMTYADKLHARHAHGPHWYLWFIGVEAACQGQGIGGRLLQPILARADAGGLPCYLETGGERNVRFYEKHGFKVAYQGQEPTLGAQVYAMLREPVQKRRSPT
jgi:ribosomal protein S18 acetylase RimI-like enzyme